MKGFFFVFFFTFLIHHLYAQDLIITTGGESLECKIVEARDDYIEYTYQFGERTNKFSISRKLVKEYKFNHYIPNSTFPDSLNFQSQGFPKLRLALDFGLSYRTGKIPQGIPQGLNNYMQEVKKGYHFGGYLGCIYNENFGFGFKANHFKSVTRIENASLTFEDGLERKGLIEDNISISYMGPAFSSSIILGPNQSLIFATASAGLIQYTNKATLIDPFLLRGSNLGFSLDLGYDRLVSKNLGWGIQLSFVAGALTQLEMEKGTKKETIYLNEQTTENLSRLDLSVGIRFR